MNAIGINIIEDEEEKFAPTEIDELQDMIDKRKREIKMLEGRIRFIQKHEVPDIPFFKGEDKFIAMSADGSRTICIYGREFVIDQIARNRRGFLSQEEFIEYKTKTQYIADMIHYKRYVEPDYIPNWDNMDETKWYIVYDHMTKDFRFIRCINIVPISSVIFSCKEYAEGCAKFLNDLYCKEDKT